MPLSEPITGVDSTDLKEIPVPKDTTVVVAIYSHNRSKAIWALAPPPCHLDSASSETMYHRYLS